MKINKNKINKIIKKMLIFMLMLLFVFSNFVSYLPEVFQNNDIAKKFSIKNAQAATVNKTFSFTINSENFIGTSGGKSVLAYDSAYGNPQGSLKTSSSGRNNNDISNWTWTGTWETLGAPIGSTITNMSIDSGYTYINTWNFVDSVTIGPYKIRDSLNVDQATLWNGRTVTTGIDGSWVAIPQQANQNIPFAIQSSNSIIKLYLERNLDLGNNSNAQTALFEDELSFTITYDLAVAPPNATGFINNTEGAILDGGRSNQQITITGTDFGTGPSDEINNAVKIGAYAIPNGNVVSWNNTTIIFTIPSAAATYGGAGANGLTVRANGLDDATPLDFYIYPNITSLSVNSEQIGNNIIVNGDHFGTSAGSITINTKSAAVVGAWNENNLTVRIPGQEGAANIIGKIQITRSDIKTSNLFPSDPANFTILAPSISGSNPASATTGQSSVLIEFSGFGIDTDTGIDPILKLVKAGEDDIIGAGYSTVTAYQTASAAFDLSGAAIGAWDLAIINMDGQSGICSGCFTVNPLSAPVVTGINPDFGLNSGVRNITSITGGNFQNGAAAKLTKTFQTDIFPSTAFTFTNANTLSNGAFDLSSKALGYWNVVITNPDLQTGSYGNEIDTGFEIRSAIPSNPTNLSQSKTELGPSISEGGGVGGQVAIYLRMDMEGGSADNYTSEVEIKPYSTPLDGLSDIYSGNTVFYDPAGGIPAKGFVVFSGTDGELYHWRARVQNSSGTSGWTSFGIIPGPNDTDFYLDNTPPSIDTLCANAVTNISDLGATIQWNTSDAASGAQNPPGSGTYATAQVQYIKTDNYVDWIATPGATTIENAWENSPHQASLSSLSPGTDYTFRMRSKDGAGNEAVSANCAFTTEGARPIKTIEFFILQEANKNTGTRIKKNFSLIIPENTGIANSIQPKSAYIEINGISSATGNQTINAGLLRGDQTSEVGPAGNNYFLDSTGTTTQFTILFDALIPGSDNEDMLNITSGGNYEYTLFLNGDGITDVSLFSAKLVLTYNYKP